MAKISLTTIAGTICTALFSATLVLVIAVCVAEPEQIITHHSYQAGAAQ